MKTTLTLITVVLVASLHAAETPAKAVAPGSGGAVSDDEDMILGFRGKSKYQIVVPDVAANEAAESSVARAAGLLQQAFAANKITLDVVKESQADATRPGFYLGATKFAAAKGVELKQLKVPGGFSAYLYNWGNFHLVGLTPLTTVAMIAEQNRLLVSNNVRAVQVNGVPGAGQWGLEGPNIYVYLRLAIDPTSQSASALFDEYLQAAFRECKDPMRRFFTNLQKRVELWQIIGAYAYQSGRDPIFALGTLWTPDVINSLEEDLASAQSSAQLPEVKRRLDIVRYEFDFLKHLALVINAWRNHQAMNDAQSLNQLLDAVDARNGFVAKVVHGDDKYPKKKNPAYLSLDERGVKYAGRYLDREPFNWDIAKMRANPAQLSQQSKSLEVAKVAAPLTLDSPLWQSAEEHTLGPVEASAAPLQAQTTFRVLCDDSYLYVRVSGEQPAGKMKFVARGHDAELWLQESIIVNVSPFADRSRYFYFAYEPEPTSFNDAEHGFITDFLHPRYGWNDESWNGKWTFETKLLPDKNRWESMAVIPFETLRVAAPKQGDMWYLNRINKELDQMAENF